MQKPSFSKSSEPDTSSNGETASSGGSSTTGCFMMRGSIMPITIAAATHAAKLPHRCHAGTPLRFCGTASPGFMMSLSFCSAAFFQYVSVHTLLGAFIRLYLIKCLLYFVFVHASSPPRLSLSFARASRSWFRTVDAGLFSIAAISSVW